MLWRRGELIGVRRLGGTTSAGSRVLEERSLGLRGVRLSGRSKGVARRFLTSLNTGSTRSSFVEEMEV